MIESLKEGRRTAMTRIGIPRTKRTRDVEETSLTDRGNSLVCVPIQSVVTSPERLVKELSQISKTASSKINELLYRIDISERQLKRLSTLKPEEDLLSIMAELIIKRILQKIVYKEFYKS